MSPRAPSMRILAVSACVSVALLFVSVSHAATPVKKGVYEGSAKVPESRSYDRTVRIKVSGNGKTLNFRGPHERCGVFNPLSAYYPRIEKVKISKTGKFEGKRVYTDTSRGPNYVLDWTVKLTGSFTTSNKAKGTVVYELAHRGRGGPQRQRCGKRTVTWTAKRT